MKLDLKSVLILLSVLLIATVGSAYVTSWVFTARAPVQETVSISVEDYTGMEGSSSFDPRLVWNTGPITVNLAPTPGGVQRFVKTDMSIHVNDGKTLAEISRREVQVRDKIITILRTTSPEQLTDEKGISTLKERINESMQELVYDVGGRIRHIYLTELVIQ